MSAKRKAVSGSTGATAEDGDGPAAKRRKVPAPETPETTTEVGLGFLKQIKETRDKRTRLISAHFLKLPDRKAIPEYYRRVGLPMALDMIEEKLNRRGYPSLTTLECDLRRMVSNAKSYNEKSSEIFSDAEKVRKLVVSWMTQNNPAYDDPSYTPFATPVPDGWEARLQNGEDVHDIDAEGETDPEEAAESTERPATVVRKPATNVETRRASSTPAVQDAEGAGEGFEGNTFQQAQEKIMTEMINLKNEEDKPISGPFINLPSRELRDYYRIIKHPVCLKSAQKVVRGIKGREKPTGVTLLKSWQAFEDEVGYIWNNAREYNEDGSEIFKWASQLEAYFKRRLAEARRVVAEPPQPKVKLRLSAKSPEPTPKITLRFGQKPNGSTGVAIDNEALKRQQDLVKAGANGQGSAATDETSRPGPRNPFGSSHSGSGAAPIPSLQRLSQERARSGSAENPATSLNGVKSEGHGRSPALSAVQLDRDQDGSSETRQSPNAAASTMPPPSSVTPRLPSGSPFPQTATATTHNHMSNTNPVAYDPLWRQPGKDASDALITNVSVASHPGLKLEKHFHLDIPPSPTASQQSVTINVPRTYYLLRIVPTIAATLSHRPHRIFVTSGAMRLNSMPQRAEDIDQRRPIYEARVLPGIVNRIEVEVVAGPPRGAPKVGPGQEIEIEKTTIFAHVLRE